MTDLGRRELMAAAAIGLGLAGAAPAAACSLTATRLAPFRDSECRRQLQAFVDLLNAGPQLSAEALSYRIGELPVSLDQAMVDDLVGDKGIWEERLGRFYRAFRLSDGKPDPRPITIAEAVLLRRLDNRATYQFTLARYSYHAADPEGCNGMFIHDEFYGIERKSYLATFVANRLNGVKLFPEWPLKAQA